MPIPRRSAIPLSAPATAAPAVAPTNAPPPRYDDSTDPSVGITPIEKKTAAAAPPKQANGTVGSKSAAPVDADLKGAWKELLDVSREEVQMTCEPLRAPGVRAVPDAPAAVTFFAAPWAALVLTGRSLNFLWTLIWGSPFLSHPGNILFTIAVPPLVFHFLMVVIILSAEATEQARTGSSS